MKKLLLILVLLLCPLGVMGQTTVAGTLVDTGLTTVTSNNIFVRFSLQNYTSQPRVVSTGILVKVSRDCTQAQITATTCKITANASITPANTYWQACFFNDVIRVGCLDYTVGGSFDLNSATPLSVPPVATAPTGDTTYIRSDAGNASSTTLASTFPFGIITTGKLNNILFVDGVKYTTIDAAITAAGSAKTIIGIPSNYAGAEASSVPANVTIWDFRGGAHQSLNNTAAWNSVSGSNLHTMLHIAQTITSPAVSDVTLYAKGLYGGTLPNNAALDGASSEAYTTGVLSNSPTSTDLQGFEGAAILSSTGQTIPAAYGVVGSVHRAVGNTTNVTDIAGVRAYGLAGAGGGTVVNAYGLLAEAQSGATGENLSIRAKGDSRFDTKVGIGATAGYPLDVAVTFADFEARIRNPNAAGYGLFIWNGDDTKPSLRISNAAGTANPINMFGTGLVEAKRYRSSGSALVAGDFALSAGWGTTASVGSVRGTDQFFEFVVTSAGTGQGASPTITYTPKDGTWTTAPVWICARQEYASQPTITFTTTTQTATSLVLTFNGTPVAAETFKIGCHTGGI